MLPVLRRRRRSARKLLRVARLLSDLDARAGDGRARPAVRRAERLSLARI